ncbi:protocadherin Fat 4-like [Mercenaria mercenaria]|uniref:protocadherin Fat 4-like n=1 Tax=Mercenaria mercenaria TaxID=6596 RepID=UPI00234EBD22|nr:protocadherin Fat 4-like [Mercenaria mercenaria]
MKHKTIQLMLTLLILVTLTGHSYQQSPRVHDIPNYVQKSESFQNGSVLFSVTATHPDINEEIVIHTVGAMTSSMVFINQTHGSNIRVDVITKSELDRDGDDRGLPGQESFVLRFKATDIRTNELFFNVQLYIIDTNDNFPVLHNWPYTWEIKELPYFGNNTYNNVNASDLDNGNFGDAGIRYKMKPTTQSNKTAEEYIDTFEMNEITGIVSLKKELDYETNSYYQFKVTAQDDKGNGNTGDPADLIIRVLDVQDTAPFFTGIPYRQTIQEKAKLNKYVVTVAARDGDTGVPNPVNYTILPGNCSTLFNISQDGEIRTAGEIDRDFGDIHTVAGVCILNILVQEVEQYHGHQYGNTTATTEVTITVEDLNDNPPKFGNETYMAKVQENTPEGVPITLIGSSGITIDDADEGVNARVELSLLYPNGTECHDFSISPATIQKSGSVLIRVVRPQLLDFETIQSITILIIAHDNSNANQTATVLLSVTDMNDNNPQFQNSSYNFYVAENSNSSTSVGTITAMDEDSDKYGNITYSISGGNNRFEVDRYTGKITTKCTKCPEELDREKVDIYYMTYTATDFGGRGRSNSTSLIIHITDENDNIPEFYRNLSTAFIDENDSKYNTTPVVKLEATDRDQEGTNNRKVIYSILTISESHMFDNISIHNITGELFLNNPVDFEELNNKSGIIQIIVEARDLGKPSLASNATVLIHVQDINDNYPKFNQSLFHEEITENSTSKIGQLTTVGIVSASDADGTDRNSKLQYFIQAGAMDHFAINPSSGEIYVQIGAKLDRETTKFGYNITIIAIDQGSPPRNGTTTLHIDILDVNDALPVFNQSEYSASILESAQTGTTVTSCVATDADTNNDLRYTIVDVEATNEYGGYVNSTTVKDYFGVNQTSGSVYVKGDLDRETAKTVVLTIKAEDLNAFNPSPQTATASLTITLLDINDNYPKFKGLPYNVSVSENAQDPTILLTISATDPDENRTITYQLSNTSTESNSFDVIPDTGVLRKNGHLDREDTSVVTLNVIATDNGVPPLSLSEEVIVTVLDFNDNKPEFVNFINETNVPENASPGYFVVKVSASDVDDGLNAYVTYDIEEGADGKFSINTTSGRIEVSAALDRETKPVYTLRIKAQDNPLNPKEQKSTSSILTIKIDDINDNSPDFVYQLYNVSLLEKTEVGTSVIQVLAVDKDQAETNNSLISYFFMNDTSPAGLFLINQASGEIFVNSSLIGYAGSYVLGLVAEDHGEPPKKNISAVNITVLDVNLHSPEITNLPSENLIKVYECVSLGYEVHHFNYSDADRGINAQADFNISEIDVADSIFDTFKMEASGSLKVIKKLNAMVQNTYRFQIHVTDRGVPPLPSDKTTITVKVIDVDDHLPSFTKGNATFNVKENQPAGISVGKVSAHDQDRDSDACYEIKEDDMTKLFTIGLNNGSIVTLMEFDYENKTAFTFTVQVKDCSINLNVSECENITHVNQDNYTDTINVTVNVIDVNDNPPVFKLDEITVGMRRVTEVNTTLDLSLKTSDYIEDNDTDANGKQAWVFTNAGDIQTSSSLSGKISPLGGVMHCSSDKKRHIVCVSGNGSLINNKYYSEDISGYFVLPVNVSDAAGRDTVRIKIFLIGDSQILIMTVLGNKEVIAETKNDILKIYSKVTGYEFVYDWLEDHKTPDGKVETFKTDLYFHVVDTKTDRVLSVSEALRIVDNNYEALLQAMQEFSVLQVVSSVKEAPEEDSSIKTVYILAAVIAVLALTVAIVVYVSLTTRNTYKRKLKAAMVKPQDIHDVSEKNKTVVPGSNMYSRQANPLLHAEIPEKIEYDNLSMGSHNSLDSNSVGDLRQEGDYDQMEEKEVRMDMFTEDTDYSTIPEDPLEAALKHYDMQNMQNKQDSHSTDAIVSPHDIDSLQFENKAYVGEFESTEI